MAEFDTQFDIVSFGEAMVEFNQTVEGKGRMYLQGFGGDTSNFAVAASRQGSRVAYLSALGNDPYGNMLRAMWDEEKINHQFVATNNSAYTGIYFVTHEEGGHQFSFFRSGSAATRMTPNQLPVEMISRAKNLHLSGISLAISNTACDTAYSAIQCARKSGVLVSFDTNLRLKLWSIERARAVMTDVMKYCDICLPSYDDITAISGLNDPDEIVDYCLGLGAKVVALKLGSDGAIVADKEQRHKISPFACNPIDATGAGDTFGGAFVSRLLQKDDLLTAGRYAAVAAALSTQGYGAVEPIPYASEVLHALSNC